MPILHLRWFPAISSGPNGFGAQLTYFLFKEFSIDSTYGVVVPLRISEAAQKSRYLADRHSPQCLQYHYPHLAK